MERLKNFLFKPVDIASLVVFRIIAGVLLSFELINQFFTGDYKNYLDPKFHFTYLLFPFVKPLPETGMYVLWGCIVLAGFLVAAGAFYRLAATALFLGYTYMFLIEETEFVNHFYLYCLLCFLLIFLPANRYLSIDSLRKPAIKRNWVPAWALYLLIFHISIVYFFGGVAKLHEDWLMARPLKVWLSYDAGRPVVGPILGHWLTPWVMAYVGVIFDLLFVPLLLYRRTRILGFTLAALFHFSNAIIFGLATFPWFSLTFTSLYFTPDWPRSFPVVKRFFPPLKNELPEAETVPESRKNALIAVFGIYALIHFLLPFRHFMYPGNVNWTEEGHKFAWHMMLRAKSGSATFYVAPSPDSPERIYINQPDYLTPHQIDKMADQPDLILQFARFLKAEYQKKGFKNPAVYVQSSVSLNGRLEQPLVPADLNLAAQKRHLSHYNWIVPLKDYQFPD